MSRSRALTKIAVARQNVRRRQEELSKRRVPIETTRPSGGGDSRRGYIPPPESPLEIKEEPKLPPTPEVKSYQPPPPSQPEQAHVLRLPSGDVAVSKGFTEKFQRDLPSIKVQLEGEAKQESLFREKSRRSQLVTEYKQEALFGAQIEGAPTPIIPRSILIPTEKAGFIKGEKRITSTAEALRYFAKKEAPIRESILQPIEIGAEKFQSFVDKSFQSPVIPAVVSFGTGFVEGGVGAVRTVVRPVKTYRGIKTFLTNKEVRQETLYALGEQMYNEPIRVAGQFVGAGYTFKKIGKLNPVKLRNVKIPFVEKGTDIITSQTKAERIFTGVSLEYQARAQPIIGVSKHLRPVIGTPSAKLITKITSGRDIAPLYQPVTATAGKIYAARFGELVTKPSPVLVEGKLISSELQKELVQKGRPFIQKYQRQGTKFVSKDILKSGTRNMPAKDVQKFLNVVKKRNAIIFGGKATQPFVKGYRQVGDIDVYVERISAEELALEAVKSLGKKYKISELTHITKRGVKVIEIKDINTPDIQEGVTALPKIYGLRTDIPSGVTKIDGIRVAKISKESLRKFAGSTIHREEGVIGVAHEGRFKDVPDLFAIAKAQVGAVSRLRPFRLRTGKAFLEVGEKLFPSGIPQQKVLAVFIPKIKIPIELGLTRPSINLKIPESRVSIKISQYRISPRPSPRISPSISPSISPRISLSISPSISPRISPSISPSISPRISPSISPSPSPSPRPSPSPSPSPSPRPSPSPSPSPRPSPSPSPSPSPFTTVPKIRIPLIFKPKSIKKKFKIKYIPPLRKLKYKPSLLGIIKKVKVPKYKRSRLEEEIFSGLEIRGIT